VVPVQLRRSPPTPSPQDVPSIHSAGLIVVSSVNSSLLNYLTAQGANSPLGGGTTGQATAATKGVAISQAALQHAAGTAKATSAAQALETRQKQLGTDLRAAMAKAGVKLTGALEFSVGSDGQVETQGADGDKAAVKAFMSADDSRPSFATRIANQAQDALKLSSSIQQSAAISQAAKYAKSTSGVLSLYASMMQRAGPSSVVFSVTPDSSSLSYPGSLATDA